MAKINKQIIKKFTTKVKYAYIYILKEERKKKVGKERIKMRD